jgi:F0F1-type ATP synthase assembly protein I
MSKPFKDVENEFEGLKKKFRQKKISEPEYKQQLKSLRLRDKDGRFWTIGAQTGKWYYFDGEAWVQAQPPSLQEKKAICIHCGFENDLENESCAYCGESLIRKELICPKCGSQLDEHSMLCPVCDEEEKMEEKSWEALETFDIEAEETEDEKEEERAEQILRFINPVSLFLFSGAVGLLFGIIIGSFTGATDFFLGVVQILPAFLRELHGNLIGGIFYGLFGGIFGFLVLGICGFLAAVLFNLILSFIGGVKIHVDNVP